MKFIPLLCFCIAFLCVGCLQRIAVSTVGGIVDDGFEGFTEEQDLDLAEKALPANLKLLEVMLKNSPDDERLLRLLSEGYSSYTLGFVEDVDIERARRFYLRGRDYGLRILRQDRDLAKALDGSVDDLSAELAKRDKDDVPGVFWTAFGWASYISLSLTNPDALIDLPRVEAMMRFVVRTDSAYYYGGAYVFLGTLYGSRPKMLGGDIERANDYFEKALTINQGKFLMTHIYYARSVAVLTLDDALFEELLATVANTSLDVLPGFRLANAIAKRKAKVLLERKADFF